MTTGSIEGVAVSWKPYEALMPLQALRERLDRPLKIVGEPIKWILPSIVLGTDGLLVKSIFFTTEHYLCEATDDTFDVSYYPVMQNLRVELSTQKVKDADGSSAAFELATVRIMHGGSFHSELYFAGSRGDRERWLSDILVAFPPTILLPALRK